MMSEPKPLLDWNNQPIPVKPTPDRNANPCVTEYGTGPDGAQCKDCTHIVQLYAAKTIYKCLLRGVVGRSTDHRRGWPACAKFEERTEGAPPFYRK